MKLSKPVSAFAGIVFFLLAFATWEINAQNPRARDYKIEIGVLRTGPLNGITDVPGVLVGHTTLIKDQHIRTGATAILPHSGNIFQEKVPAAIYVGNGFGKLAGSTQVEELGVLETPIVLTNTLSVPTAMNALISYTLELPGNEKVRSVNALVGETNDGFLNDIRGRHLQESHVREAIRSATKGPVKEGNVGAGTGTVCFGFKGGIGTSSRVLPRKVGGYTVGVLVQSNFGGILQINGVPVGKELGNYSQGFMYDADGSCMIVVATDAPLNSRNLKRLAKRAILGLGRTGGIASNGSGDYVIAFSTYEPNLSGKAKGRNTEIKEELKNDAMSPLFLAVIEATEEAIINSLFAAETMNGRDNHGIDALPLEKVLPLLQKE
ncbi:DmpA family aminopeptidase [Lentiprolixibacter aurantiacus]|uniref:P1 family peptidase n=1 Tax=Lentiprolixibacter aurantiacus TaxID=2993939 RepID=A0AAE3MJD4_9FLAO|nr:P1 family peptidase [Lentiprolixibacter aurantiacus]MCX2718676.1 P1 family peptidase [Lentiprolixibacter aurantiacus]